MSGARWAAGENGSVPVRAVQAGLDRDGGHLFVGRISYENDFMPAKIAPKHGRAYFSYNGLEYSDTHYEVLCNVESIWQAARDGNVPANALPVGSTEDGEQLYVGRVFHDGTLTPGKVHPSHGVCYIPYGGLEITSKAYEVLVTK